MNFRENEPKKTSKKTPPREYISVYWKCCHVFSRIYKNTKQTAYEGQCPLCRSFIRASVGEGGTTQRTFIAE